MQRITCLYSGHVQGVGFRYTVKSLALSYNVGGYVRNLADGRVELVVEGPDDQVDGLLGDVRKKMTGYIDHIEQQVLPATGEFCQFSIRA
ncbi:MAG: acylphosphatase [Phycisphaerae bacterium]|nr:acylphosphatase [Phycisphaerae bacterium]MDW8262830.1 acylphosphatase [Phycisphaerales bacterium]